uniref:(northern house mosquito) hypothetical protein n=1 Tax=Culex pipiens TaxID=7175 RepID=A0A8D8AVR9_CULPI
MLSHFKMLKQPTRTALLRQKLGFMHAKIRCVLTLTDRTLHLLLSAIYYNLSCRCFPHPQWPVASTRTPCTAWWPSCRSSIPAPSCWGPTSAARSRPSSRS